MSAHLKLGDGHALRLALKEVRTGSNALAMEAEAWATQVPEHAGATMELLQRALATRRALARLSRRLALMCADHLTEEGSRWNQRALRTLARLFPVMGRLACLRCRLPARRIRKRPPQTGRERARIEER